MTVEAECTTVEGKRISFHVRARDTLDITGGGEHERAGVNWEKFEQRLNDKATRARVAPVTRLAPEALHPLSPIWRQGEE